jgi:hypothetical protein
MMNWTYDEVGPELLAVVYWTFHVFLIRQLLLKIREGSSKLETGISPWSLLLLQTLANHLELGRWTLILF